MVRPSKRTKTEPPGPTPRGGRVPFKVVIVTIVVGLLVTTCGVLISYVMHRDQRSVELLRRDYLDEVADSTVRHVAELPETAEQLLRVMRPPIESGTAPPHGIPLARALAAILQADPQIQWASYSDDPTGRFSGATRVGGDAVVLNVSDPRVHGGLPREFRLDGRTPYIRTPRLTEPYDPRTRSFYRRAAARPGVVIWMPPYTFAEGVKGVTAALAVRDTATRRLRGVLTVDFALAGVNQFLTTVRVGRQGTVALYEGSGALLAGTPGPGREAATRAVERWRAEAAGRWHDGDVVRAEVSSNGTEWAVTARAITRGAGLEWIVAAAVPEEEFMGPVHANRRAAIAIVGVGLLAAVLAGIGLSTGIARSLGGATETLDRIARFDLEWPGPRRSMLREVAFLQDAVGRVRASLRSFSRYAPEEVVRDVVVSGREAMLSGERREVTVLFSDLRGFSATAGRLRPEEVLAILNDHFDHMVAMVVRHGGFVVDFLGDSVFAVFGAPGARARHAQRAATCAIEMQVARATRNAVHRARGWPPLEMGVALNTGPAVVGNMGSHQRIKYGVVGHVVNVAARIEAFTVGGQVFAAEATRQALGSQLVADGPLEVEGKGTGELRVWDVRGLRIDDTVLTLPSLASELVAQDPPLLAEVRLILGKQVDRRAYAARVFQLGAAGADLDSEAPWTLFTAAELLLPTELAVDGKVIALPAGAGGGRAVMRFTGADWTTQARIEALARRAPMCQHLGTQEEKRA